MLPESYNRSHRKATFCLHRQHVILYTLLMSDKQIPFDPRELIREARIAAGLTQAEVAEGAEIPRSKLSLYESGFVELNAEEMRAVEKFLKQQSKRRGSGLSNMPALLLHRKVGPEYSEGKVGPQLSPRQQFLKTSVQKILADGKLAAEWRKLAGMSQYEASRRAKISRTKLSAWENGDIQLPREEAVRCCEIYAEADRKKKMSDPWTHLDEITRERDELKDRVRNNERRAEILKEKIAIGEKLIAIQERLEAAYKEWIAELSQEGTEKDGKILGLEKQVAEFRAYYDAGTEAALAHARFEELGEKVSVPDVKGRDE